MMRRFALSGLLLACAFSGARAQSSATPLSPNDSVFRRARRSVSDGNGAAGRAVVDSLLKREQEGSTGYGNALYWRGALAETAADAERDYRRVIVEYPLSAYADDALLAIAELEQARGDRAGALLHLQRFVKEHAASPARGTAAFAAARLAFEQRDARAGCAMIAEARASVPSTDVELRNQIDYAGARCNTADAGASAAVVTAPVGGATQPVAREPASVKGKKVVPSIAQQTAPSAKAPKAVPPPLARTPAPLVPVPVTPPAPVVTVPAPDVTTPPATVVTTPPAIKTPADSPEHASPAARSRGSYTIQLAAYNTRAEAERLVTKLGARGVKARVSGASKPFRVRLDFYATRQAALDAVAALKQRGIVGFVTSEEPPTEGKAP